MTVRGPTRPSVAVAAEDGPDGEEAGADPSDLPTHQKQLRGYEVSSG